MFDNRKPRNRQIQLMCLTPLLPPSSNHMIIQYMYDYSIGRLQLCNLLQATYMYFMHVCKQIIVTSQMNHRVT